MESNLNQAFQGVFSSSKEIFKKNQRHLFCNALDLLTNTWKTSGLTGNQVVNNDLVEFWLGDILPLVFDPDLAIQNSAIYALEQSISDMVICVLHKHPRWAEYKSKIVTNFGPRIHKLREARSRHWHQIWCLLIRILDREVLKGASTINTFLSIVELGFRSSDNLIRAEAFSCWRLLIQIFSMYNELSSAKRMKLICIPLKSSQSKSPHTAEVKLRVWWYLLTCLEHRICDYFESVLEPFLIFCFGASAKAVAGAAQQYTSISQLALPCLVALLSDKSNDCLERRLREFKLESLEMPSPVLATDVVKGHWLLILNTATEAIRLFTAIDTVSTESEQKLIEMLLRILVVLMNRLDSVEYNTHFCTELTRLLPDNPRPVVCVLNILATENIGPLKHFDNYVKPLTDLILVAKSAVPPAILQRCINKIYSPENIDCSENKYRCINEVSKVIFHDQDEKHADTFDLKIGIWTAMSSPVEKYVRENILDSRSKEHTNLLTTWVLWPIQSCISFNKRQIDISFDSNFYTTWKELLNIGHSGAPGQQVFQQEVVNTLKELLNGQCHKVVVEHLLESYAAVLMKTNTDMDVADLRNLFVLLTNVFEQKMSEKLTKLYVTVLRNILSGLKQEGIEELFEAIKLALVALWHIVNQSNIDVHVFGDVKRIFMEKLRGHPNKSFAKEVKDMFKGNNDFVIIPSVWSLNPEKLTERQKERFAEKANIPALYNDMSQSQDNQLQPWTPKRIIIARAEQNEVAINNFTGAIEQQAEKETSVQTEHHSESLANSKKRETNTRKSSESKKVWSATDTAHEITSKQNDTSGLFEGTRARKTRSSEKLTESVLPADIPVLAKSTNVVQEVTIGQKPGSKLTKEDQAEESSSKANELSSEIDANIDGTIHTSTRDVNSSTRRNELSEDKRESNSEYVDAAKLNSDFPREVSPKKTANKFVPLSSPPDRKLTNNTTSPTLRHKPSSHLTGRGAQLINMIRNKKSDAASQCASSTTTLKYAGCLQKNEVAENRSTFDFLELNGSENNLTPTQSRELLIFSKRLPSPSASPSAGILKRKMRLESMEDISIESPAMKRKRVSFHDPPVSVTKEYVKETDESKIKPKRCLILDKTAVKQGSETKHLLKRRSKLDSMIEIEKYSTEEVEKSQIDSDTTEDVQKTITDDSINESLNLRVDFETKDLSSMDPETVLEFVSQHYSLNSVLQKYFSAEANTLQLSSSLAKFLSDFMVNPKIKLNVLEILSENHSKDFLDHAVQENLSSVVCDRLNLNSVIDYICAKSKINTNCRNNLLLQITEIFKDNKPETESVNFIKNILQLCNFSDSNVLNLISVLINMRSQTDKNAISVSESAVDSSSNL